MNTQTVIFNKISFVNVVNPRELELKDLRNNFGFNPLHIEDYVHKTQTPKIESSKNYDLIVLDIPLFNHENGVQNTTNADKKISKSPINSLLSISHATLSSMPIPHFLPHEKKMRVISNQVALFIGKDYLVVMHSGITPINHIFSLCQKTLHNRNEFLSQGSVYLAYRIIDSLIDMCFPVINKISGMIDHIDKELEREHSQNTLEDISVTRRNIVVFHTMIKPIIPLFEQLKLGKYERLNGNVQQYWADILNHLQKIWDRLEDSQELIEGISESNESLLSSKTNQIIRVLTIFSAIVLPLNLIASIYGMNIRGLPFAQDQNPFVLILLTMLIIGGVMLFVFKIKRWF